MSLTIRLILFYLTPTLYFTYLFSGVMITLQCLQDILLSAITLVFKLIIMKYSICEVMCLKDFLYQISYFLLWH